MSRDTQPGRELASANSGLHGTRVNAPEKPENADPPHPPHRDGRLLPSVRCTGPAQAAVFLMCYDQQQQLLTTSETCWCPGLFFPSVTH